MADFLTRLAERTLGVAPVAQPIIASMFANGRTMPNSPSVAEGFPVQDDVEALTAPQPPAVHPAQPAQSTPSPQSTLPGNRISKHPDDRRGRLIAPTADVSARNPDSLPSNFPPQDTGGEMPPQAERSESHGGRDPIDRVPGEGRRQPLQQNAPFATSIPQDVEPPEQASNLPGDRISILPGDRISILPGDRISNLPGDRRGRLIAPTAAVSARNPDPFPSNFTPPNTGGEMLPQAERSDGHGGRDPIYRVPGGWWGQHRQQNAPFATSIPQDVEPPDQDGDRRGRLIAPTAALSAHRPAPLPSNITPIDAQGEQVGRPGGAPFENVVSHRLETQNNPQLPVGLDSAQQLRTSARVRGDLLPEQQSLLQNRQVATSQRLPAPVSEAASSTPTIHVTIGRIDVRAVTPPAPPPRPKQARPGPTLSLDDYARQRKGGER